MPILDHFSLIAPYYDRFIQAGEPEKLISLLSLPSGGRLLDIGGGTGRVSAAIRGRVAQIYVLDASFRMLIQASQKQGLSPVCSESERLPFTDCSFERIIIVDALHHVANQSKTAKDMWRVLKPGGLIVIEEPNLNMPGVKIIALAEKLLLMRSHLLTPENISRLFDGQRANIRVETEEASCWVVIEKT